MRYDLKEEKILKRKKMKKTKKVEGDSRGEDGNASAVVVRRGDDE